MRRKLVKQGRNALTVTLPAAWVKRFGLNPGSEVFIDERDESLLISGSEMIKRGKKIVDVSGLDLMIKRILAAIYKSGCDEVEVRFDTPEELEKAQEVIREQFVGFEITHHGKNNLIIKDISAVDPQQFNTMMRRLFLLINSVGDDCLEAIKKNNTNLLKIIALRDKDINKIANFCRRVLNNYGHLIEGETAPLYYIAEQLEKIGDIYRDICMLVIKNEIKPHQEIINFFQEINAFFRDFYNLYFDFELKKMTEFGKKRYNLLEKSDKLMESASKKDFSLIFHLKEITKSTFDMNGPLMAVKL